MKIPNLKNVIKKFIPKYIFEYWKKYLSKREVRKWKEHGKPLPPPHAIKQAVILGYKEKGNVDLLIETGTYLGDMVYAQCKNFSKIHSIELSNELYKNAVKRFNSFPHIKIHYGDSGKVLNEIVSTLGEKAIFWLDGHYSGGITAKGDKECPIFEELGAILNSDLGHIILVDDARLFDGKGGYPSIKEVEAFIEEKKQGYKISVEEDIIRAVLY